MEGRWTRFVGGFLVPAAFRGILRALQQLPDARLVAVGSRNLERADRFADEFGVSRRYGSYEELVQDADVDVIYIGTPHSVHAENALLCLKAGKPVLCEKPFTINVAEAQAVIELARRQGLFLMEAMWTRFLPAMVKARELLAAGAIGEPRMLQADFGFRTDFDPQGRLFAPELGGGALLDVGTYVVSLASMVFGAPEQAVGLAHLGATGVDEQAAMVLRYPGGQLASLSIALRTALPQTAMIMGTEGMLHVPSPWWRAHSLHLIRPGQEAEVLDLSFEGHGFHFEAAEVMRCLRAGALESEIMPLDESLAIMRTLDQIRAPWGLRYPGESQS